MTLSRADLWALLRLTLTDPSQAAQVLLGLALPPAGRMAALGLVTALSAMLLWAVYAVFPMQLPDGTVVPTPGPLFWAVMVATGLAVLAVAILGLGRLAGGRGTLSGILTLLAWFQFVQLAMFVAQVVLLLALPPLGILLTLVSLGLTVWILAHFIRAAHGFASIRGPVLAILAVGALLFLLLLNGA